MTAAMLSSRVDQDTSGRSRFEDVYEQLKQDIADFKLVPGDRFTEMDMCERFGMSRTPIRQALYRLQQEGYVEVLFRSGWRILPFDFEKYEQLYDLRMVLESAAVQRLCEQRTEGIRSSLQALEAIWLTPPAERCQDGKQVGLWDEAFHCALVNAAGNQEMARVHREITDKIRVIRRMDFTQSQRLMATYDEHAEILKAILAYRADQACMLLRSHITTSQSEVRKITLHQWYLAKQES
jgi:DNA-binding GntR family transcriptional regulator